MEWRLSLISAVTSNDQFQAVLAAPGLRLRGLRLDAIAIHDTVEDPAGVSLISPRSSPHFIVAV